MSFSLKNSFIKRIQQLLHICCYIHSVTVLVSVQNKGMKIDTDVHMFIALVRQRSVSAVWIHQGYASIP